MKSCSIKETSLWSTIFLDFVSKTCCVKVDVFSVWKFKHSIVGKANCHITMEGCLVFERIVIKKNPTYFINWELLDFVFLCCYANYLIWKQKVPCIMCISISEAKIVGKKSTFIPWYTGKQGNQRRRQNEHQQCVLSRKYPKLTTFTASIGGILLASAAGVSVIKWLWYCWLAVSCESFERCKIWVQEQTSQLNC